MKKVKYFFLLHYPVFNWTNNICTRVYGRIFSSLNLQNTMKMEMDLLFRKQ